MVPRAYGTWQLVFLQNVGDARGGVGGCPKSTFFAHFYLHIQSKVRRILQELKSSKGKCISDSLMCLTEVSPMLPVAL